MEYEYGYIKERMVLKTRREEEEEETEKLNRSESIKGVSCARGAVSERATEVGEVVVVTVVVWWREKRREEEVAVTAARST